MHPDFYFDVTVAMAERFQDRALRQDGIVLYKDCVPDSSVLHEQVVYKEEQYCHRIRQNMHIFTMLLNACVQDGLGMADEWVEK